MGAIHHVTIEADDATTAEAFYPAAFGLGELIRVRPADAPTSGFRGFTLSLLVSQPANADALIEAARDAGATVLKPGAKSLWGYGGAIQAPDGTVWTVASSKKKDSAPATREIDSVVLQLGLDDVGAVKQFYVDHGLSVAKSFGNKYVELDTGAIKLALNKRATVAKNAGVSPDGDGSHRIAIGGDVGAFSDPEGYAWEAA